MSNENFIYIRNIKQGTSFTVSEDIKDSTWVYSDNQKSGDYSVNIGIRTPSWNQVIDDSAPKWVNTWDWVFSKALDTIEINWEDWG